MCIYVYIYICIFNSTGHVMTIIYNICVCVCVCVCVCIGTSETTCMHLFPMFVYLVHSLGKKTLFIQALHFFCSFSTYSSFYSYSPFSECFPAVFILESQKGQQVLLSHSSGLLSSHALMEPTQGMSR